jgi:hypothetical protein
MLRMARTNSCTASKLALGLGVGVSTTGGRGRLRVGGDDEVPGRLRVGRDDQAVRVGRR